MAYLKANAIVYMEINKIFFKISLAIIVAALYGCAYYPFCLFGCTNKYWYERIKREEENKCSNQPPPAIDSCLERLNKGSYEDYEIIRRRSVGKQ
jgi:hypothetical protein